MQNDELKSRIKIQIKNLKEELAYQEELLKIVCENEGFEKLIENLKKYPYWVRDGNVVLICDIDSEKCTVKWSISKCKDIFLANESTFVEFSAWFAPYEGVTY